MDKGTVVAASRAGVKSDDKSEESAGLDIKHNLPLIALVMYAIWCFPV